jgi:hypothetical protein
VLGSALLLWLPMQGQNASQSASGKISVKQVSTTRAAAQGTVRHVSVRGSEANLEIEIDTAGSPASPDTQAIADPDRIVIDFPGALPAAELRALEVNRGALKRVRTGLFFSNPPITRVVLDLTGPRNYRVMSSVNAVIVKLEPPSGSVDAAMETATTESSGAGNSTARLQSAAVSSNPYALPTVSGADMRVPNASVSIIRTPITPQTRVAQSLPQDHMPQNQAPGVVQNPVQNAVVSGNSAQMVSSATANAQLEGMPSLLPENQLQQSQARAMALAGVPLRVDYTGGLLTIHAAKATLAEVLFEVQRQTKAEIAIPAGAEQEGVVADIGPGAARDVLATLLNGSHYNFIFVGDEDRLEKVILTQREFTN